MICRLALTAAALLVASEARADPISVTIGLQSLFGSAWLFQSAAAVYAVGFATTAALSIGLSYASQALMGKQGGRGRSQGNSAEIRYSTRQSIPPKRKAYGRVHCGGALFFEKVSPPYLVQGYLIHDGEIDGVEEIYIGTNKVSFAGGVVPNTILTPIAVGGQPDYANNLRVCVRLGADDQAHDPLLRDRFGSDVIPDTYRQRGIATVVLEYRHPGSNFDAFQALWGNGRQPNPLFLIRSRRIYDPRDPSQSADVPVSWKYANNATLCQTDYIRAAHGGRIATSKINWDKVVAAATYDDTPMGTLEGPALRKHTCDGMYALNQPPSDVMGDLLTANRGTYVQEGGKVWPESSAPKARVLTITDDMLVGGLQYQPFKNRRELVNIVEPRFVAEEISYETVAGPEWRDEALIAAHGEPHRASLSLPFTLDHRRCQRLTKLFGLTAQQEASLGVQVDLVALADAMGPLTGGVVTVQSNLFPQANGDYEVRTMGFTEGFSAIELACVAYDGAIESSYDPALDEKPFDPSAA